MAVRILVVEDMEAIRSAIVRYFVGRGCHADSATTVHEARLCILRGDYDVVITDLRLDGGDAETDGFAIARFARFTSPKTRIVILTAYGSPCLEEEARRIGIERLLPKPQPLVELWALVQELAGQAPLVRTTDGTR